MILGNLNINLKNYSLFLQLNLAATLLTKLSEAPNIKLTHSSAKHIRSSFLQKQLHINRKKLHFRCLTGFWMRLCKRSGMEWVKSCYNFALAKGSSPNFASSIRQNQVINFYSPWNHQKTIGFLMISGGITNLVKFV